MAIHEVARTSDFNEKKQLTVTIGNRSIGIYQIEDEYHALLNYCPHQGAPLCKGHVTGTTMPSNVYEYIYGKEQQIVRCPWHGWEFDIKTGQSLFSDKIRARSYKAWAEDGKVFVEV